MIAYIYMISNDVNKYKYIGQTRQLVKDRLKQHIWLASSIERKTKFYDAINKIGSEHFSVEVLEECDEIDLDKLEIQYIKKYNSFENGYNSTPGGRGGFNITEIDTDEFISDYLSGIALLDIANKFGIVIQTAMKIRDRLELERERDINVKSNNKNIKVIQYDKYFNPIKVFNSIKDIIDTLNVSNYAYCYIKQSIKIGNIAYGYRWQALSDLIFYKDNKIAYYNTIFDKIEHENNNRDIELTKFGTYIIYNIYYPDYVGLSAAPECKICGSKLNRDGICSKCIKRQSINEQKENREQIKAERIKIIKQLVDSESLSEIGRRLGVSAAIIKRICVENNIEYKTKHKKEDILMVDAITQYNEIIDLDEAVARIINDGKSTNNKYGIKAKIKSSLDTNRIAFGYYWYNL